LDGGDLGQLLAHAQGLVTINSTVGTAAMAAGKPVLALGSAIYVMDGLTFSGGLDRYWKGACAPDTGLFQAFVKALASSVQLRGGLYHPAAVEAAVREAARRLDAMLVNEPGAYLDRPPRHVDGVVSPTTHRASSSAAAAGRSLVRTRRK
jgi:capsular polysaccharide export protein